MIHAVLNQNLSHALETLLAVSVLIAIVLMVRRSVSRHFGAGIVYLLWAIPVVRLFLPPLPSPRATKYNARVGSGRTAARSEAKPGKAIGVGGRPGRM